MLLERSVGPLHLTTGVFREVKPPQQRTPASVDIRLTLCDLQLSLGVSQRREQVQFDPGLCTQTVFQVLRLVLHG